MELEIMYPGVIILSLVVAVGCLYIWKGENNFKKGIVIANTRYVKETGYFKKLMIKYQIYNVIIKITYILLIFLCAVLASRYHAVYNNGTEVNNRDIMLCMDISESVNSLNKDLVKTMKDTVLSLKTERIGVTIFDSMPFSLVPLTTDYKYVLSMLNQVGEALKTKYNPFNPGANSYTRDFLYGNASLDNNGYSLVGDGLAYCASRLKENDNNRTKIIILTTDNEVVGEQVVTIPEVAKYCKKNRIKIYSIGTSDIHENSKNELINISNATGGEYYDINSFSTKDIASNIISLNKSSIVKTTNIVTKDFPDKIVPYILVLIPILFILEWRIRA